jgi:hypothetical protein
MVYRQVRQSLNSVSCLSRHISEVYALIAINIRMFVQNQQYY